MKCTNCLNELLLLLYKTILIIMIIKIQSLIYIVLFSFATKGQTIDYQDVAEELNIDHTFSNNTSGSGVSLIDFDGDGLDDITLGTNDNDEIHFYKNTGQNFIRVDIGINNINNTKSLLWVDFDNDGDKDLYVAGYKSINRLYSNNGNMNMVDITEESNLPTTDSLNTYGAIWGDYDRDGWLDIYYSERINVAADGKHRNRLFRNKADGTFEDVTEISGAKDEDKLPFCSAFVDINNDKWPDIYTANDKKKGNTLLENNKDGTFIDVSEVSNAGLKMDAMCVAPGDYNNDQKIDIYLSNIATGGKLLTNKSINEECIVEENAADKMVAMFGGIGWGSVFGDINNDGWEDLYVSGMLVGLENYSSQLFVNDGLGAFYEDNFGFVGDTVRSFNNAIGDIDNDGQLEIMVINSGGFQSQLWKSEKSNNGWIKIKLKGVKSNRDGIGAWIKAYTSDNNIQSRYTTCGNGFMGQNSNNIHFGLGINTTVDSIIVTWPTGHIDKLTDISSDQLITITEGETTGGIINIDNDINILSDNKNFVREADVNLYPNPVSNILNIECNIEVKTTNLFDLNGINLLRGKTTKMDVSLLPNGIYFLEILTKNDEVIKKKIIKI